MDESRQQVAQYGHPETYAMGSASARLKRLILYGYDPILLMTRCSILKMAGFASFTIAGSRSFKDILDFAVEPDDLWLICHTVPIDERNFMEALAAQRKVSIFLIEMFTPPLHLVAEVGRLVWA